MATTEKYTTIIELNSEQAKRNLDELRKKVESWKSDLAEARENKMGKSFITAIRKELREAEKELKKYDNEVSRTIDTMNDLQHASVDRIEAAQKNLKKLASEVPHDSSIYTQLNEQLDMVTQELENIKAMKVFEQMQEEAKGATRSAEQLNAELVFIKETAANAETEQQLAELTHRYAMGKILYCDYIDEQDRIQLEGIERRMLIYGKESLEYQKLNRQREELLLNGSKESQKLTLEEMKAGHSQRLAAIEEMVWRENMTEAQKNEMVFEEDMRFLDEQRILYQKGTLERINLENEIEDRQQQHSLQQEQYYQQQLQQVREQYLGQDDESVRQLALKNLDDLHNKGLLKEVEYQLAIRAIKEQYGGLETHSDSDQKMGASAASTAKESAKKKLEEKGSSSVNIPIVGDIMLFKATMEELELMYKDDENAHAQYLEAKKQATKDFCDNLATNMQAAYSSVNQLLSAASGYFSAQQEYETAQVQKKYEKEIEAAGNNQKKVKKLQEKQQKEEAAIKTKYAKRAAAIQMAQAVAQTAIGAINAYSSALAIPVVGLTLAPIAAAIAIAAGMLQIATIKKQQQIQEAGYYEGGFTGGRRYRKEAGVVHEGEFVANHQAVNNPNVLPFLNFIDQAQRNNTVGSLTMQDVSRSVMGVGTATQVVAPVVNVQTDNEELKGTLQQVNESIDNLNQQLLDGISVAIDGPNGLHKQYSRYLKLNNRP